MNQCDGCRAGKPRLRYENGRYVRDPKGRVHAMGDPGRYIDLMSCTRNLYECEHTYEQVPHCSGRVCLDCGDHPGRNRCQTCGWKRGDETIPELQPGNPSLELASQGEVAAEGAAAVVNKREGHGAILAMAAASP